ncbi:hypothetical protein D9613_009034 [Agrocybe pediades]|uniref:AB hydrolase-1 domain-containing protein n=1 Tax=Agrocybe pediades TaxID=84607 RepID=A0A8H4R4Q5_9AGAR|nr:hypothetical protein D9613_009034 [Agrocybe pediades]
MDHRIVEAEADFDYPAAGKPLKTWYRITGDLSSDATPLIILHSGPGAGCTSYDPLFDLTTKYSIPVIQYEQVGCGRSTHLRDESLKKKGIEFWNDGIYVAELESLVKWLKLEKYDVLGHSWGGMFGSRFAAKQPKGLRRLIIMSSPASMPLWEEAQSVLLKQMPQDVQDVIAKHEKEGTTDSPEYQSAMGAYYAKHLCRVDPMPKELLESFELLEKDPTCYHIMQGPSEFFITGTLKEWSVIDEVSKISVPTLLLNGKYDEAQDGVMMDFFTRVPKVKWVQFAESSHMAQFEERERFMYVVGTWLAEPIL